MLEKLRARGGEDDVVDVEQQVNSVDTVAVDEQRWPPRSPGTPSRRRSSGTTLAAPVSGRRGTC
jgi:hypothetical protein